MTANKLIGKLRMKMYFLIFTVLVSGCASGYDSPSHSDFPPYLDRSRSEALSISTSPDQALDIEPPGNPDFPDGFPRRKDCPGAIGLFGERSQQVLSELTTGAFYRTYTWLLPSGRFEAGNARLTPEIRQDLTLIAELIRAQPLDARILLIGHASVEGGELANQRLSAQRSREALVYLAGLGISGERILGVGLGESNPLVSINPLQAAHLSRRLEIVMLVPSRAADSSAQSCHFALTAAKKILPAGQGGQQ